ncbi:hypothetical protein AMTR_s00037p00211650 [Amborella trichopoda]|uniref:Uncharacterized protein n=1 Tax=Amborella trichopoda TaxID=13333 RepID=U5CVP7_AMBTC|nr:hypothetical protein AMTR_s00037p00211650 [Amborella trichopoda]
MRNVRCMQVALENGIVRLLLSKPHGFLTAIEYAGIDNLVDTKLKESDRGYWDINWNLPRGQDRYQLYGVI